MARLPISPSPRAHRLDGRDSDISLFLVDLKAGGVEAKSLTNVDPTRGQAELTFKNAKAEPLGAAGEGWSPDPGARPRRRAAGVRAGRRLRPRARNGPRLCARSYRLRPADRLVPGGEAHPRRHVCLGDLARSNCYGAWALSTNASNCRKRQPLRASARRRRSSTAPKNNIQVHGGMGFTWEFDCQACTTAAPTPPR